jgi:hypothetical protein
MQDARFMCFVNSNLAREAGRLTGWRERFWARRYQAIVVSQEEGAQIGRLRYLLAHGCKEGLVARPRDWPGVHGIDALLTGEPLAGYWFDRTREYAARACRERFERLRFATAETLSIEPLPCWRHLSVSEIRKRIRDLLMEIEAAVALERQGEKPLGIDAILRQDPHEAPERPKRSPAPDFHAVTRAARDDLREAYRQFVSAFRAAATKLRAGDRSASFPPGSFPPAMPFVEALHPT